MSSKTALDRELRSLRDLLDRERKSHADILKAKNDALRLAQAFNPLYELDRELPSLNLLLVQLVRAQDAAIVLRSAVGDGRSHNMPTPYESGASTRGDRNRLAEFDRRLASLAEWMADQFTDRGPVSERPPQCGNPQCPAHAWAQPYDAEVCGSCGMPFGKYYPKLSQTRRRCKTNSCPYHDQVGECEHSLLGSSRSTPNGKETR